VSDGYWFVRFVPKFSTKRSLLAMAWMSLMSSRLPCLGDLCMGLNWIDGWLRGFGGVCLCIGVGRGGL
jgi:hypothetical protein